MPFERCECQNTEIRRKGAGSNARFAAQCVDCGRMVGSWLKRSQVGVLELVRPWDEDLRDRHFRRQMDEHRLKSAADRQEWFRQHTEYLRTDAWQRRRIRVLERSEGLCEGCRERAAAHVHHLSYAHWQRELLYELVALCEPCHRKAHEAAP
jgi:hypothetical protein